jgi:hypothetical protein
MDRCAAQADIAHMAETKMQTFEEFRFSHDDSLRAQRETLRDDAAATAVLSAGSVLVGWVPWDGFAFAPAG